MPPVIVDTFGRIVERTEARHNLMMPGEDRLVEKQTERLNEYAQFVFAEAALEY